MAYIEEQQESRTMKYSAKSASTSRMYHMFDYPDSQDAIIALSNYIPVDVTVGNAICGSPEYDITPVFSDPDRTLYEATVTWKTPDIASGGGDGGSTNTAKDPKKPEDPTSITVSFGTRSELVQNSITSDGKVLVSGTWVAQADLIARGIHRQHPELPPEGVEVNVPVVILTTKTVVGRNVASAVWQQERFDQLWTTNLYEWYGLPFETVMFTGIEMSQRYDNDWDVTYTFEYRPTPGIKPFEYWTPSGPATTTMYLAPWDIVDVRYMQVEKAILPDGFEETVRSPSEILTHRIYEYSDFSLLGMVGID